AMAVDPFLELHLLQQVVDGDGARLGDHAADADAPWALLDLLGAPPDVLVVVDFVIVVVGGGVFLVGDGAAGDIFGVERPHRAQRTGRRPRPPRGTPSRGTTGRDSISRRSISRQGGARRQRARRHGARGQRQRAGQYAA